MKRIFQKLGMVVASLLSFLSASAYDFEVDGIYYNIISLSDLTCGVTSGDNKYKGDITIPAKVSYNDETLSVISIEQEAFRYCTGLISITIPNSVTKIEREAFYHCSDLISVEIPNSVIEIGRAAFQYCSDLKSVTIPNSVTIIECDTFSGCTGLTSVEIPNSVTKIKYGAFSDCTGLTSITIPNSVKHLSGFSRCTFTSITIPNSVTEIGPTAFNGCTGLTSIAIPNSVTKIDSDAFAYCKNLSSVEIPNSVKYLSGFAECPALTSITIPNSVTEIGKDAFFYCTGLTSITIPNSVIKIGDGAFYMCTGLTKVEIPNSVKYLSGFSECSGLISITIPNSVTEIGECAFSGCKGLTSITIPNSVIKIGDGAFSGCSDLTSITIPNSVTEIGEHAFGECYGLTSVEIPPSLNKIFATTDQSVFYRCAKIKKLVLLGDENAPNLLFEKWPSYNHDANAAIPFSDLSLTELYLGRVVYTNISLEKYPDLKNIEKITFGKHLRQVGAGVYSRINQIPATAEIYCENPTPPSGANLFTDQQYISNVVYVPKESLEAYKQAEGWKNFWDIRAYDPASGIKDVSVDDVRADVFKVYNLAGMLVKETVDKTEAYDLPAGIYIINGRKVAIR